jgi:hypothetical protein
MNSRRFMLPPPGWRQPAYSSVDRCEPAGRGPASASSGAGDRGKRDRTEPRYGGLAHVVVPREIGLRSAFRESLDSLLPLVAGQSRRAPKTHATVLGTDTTVAGTSKCARSFVPETAADPLHRGAVNPKPRSNLADALSAPWLVQGLTDSFF